MNSKLILRGALAVAIAAFAAPTLASTIGQIEAAGAGSATLDDGGTGTFPVITAILSAPGTVNGKAYSSYAVQVEDGTGAAVLFGKLPAGSTYVPTVGDGITAAGTYGPYNQIPEISTLTAITNVSSGNAVPSPLSVTIPQVNVTALPETIAGYMLTLSDVTITGQASGATFGITNQTLSVTDGTNSMTLYYWPTSYSSANANLFGQAVPTTPVDITGFVDVFSGTSPEFIPLSITPAAVPEPTLLAALPVLTLGLARRRR
jgi:hypothetical protein